MKILSVRNSAVVLGFAMFALLCVGGSSQWTGKTPQINQPPGQIADPILKDPNDARSVEITQKQEKSRNDERQRRLVADTDKLLALATELHEDVAKTNKNVLSIDVVRRADEIEKLAHGVKERMKG